jgi:hypothetical protein
MLPCPGRFSNIQSPPTFSQQSVGTVTGVKYLAAADMQGDSYLDVISCNDNLRTISWFVSGAGVSQVHADCAVSSLQYLGMNEIEKRFFLYCCAPNVLL